MEYYKFKYSHIHNKAGKILKGLGFSFFSFFDEYSIYNSIDIVSTYPEQWVKIYLGKKLYLIDPIIKHSHNTVKPFFWEEAGLTTESEIFKLSKEFSITSGASFVLHFNKKRLSVLSIANINKDKHFSSKIDSNINTLQMNLIELCSDLEHNSQNNPLFDIKNLTCRELEVLRWISLGKTQEETGKLLDISTRTVKFHISNILLKLDVNNVCYAIRKAVMLDIL